MANKKQNWADSPIHDKIREQESNSNTNTMSSHTASKKHKIKTPLFEAVWFCCEDSLNRDILQYECVVTANGFEKSFDGVIPITEKQDSMTLLREHIRQNIINFLADILSAEFIAQHETLE